MVSPTRGEQDGSGYCGYVGPHLVSKARVQPIQRSGGNDPEGAVGLGVSAFAHLAGPVWGTGFVVDRRGHLLTADHVTNSCSHIDVVGAHSRMPAMIEARDEANDLSLLRAEPDIGVPVEFKRDGEPAAGSLILVANFSEAQGLANLGQAQGRTLFNGMIMVGPPTRSEAATRLYIVVEARPGSSGSPVIDPNGFVAGLISSKVSWHGRSAPPGQPSEVRVAIGAASAKDFLRRHDVNFLEVATRPSNRSGRANMLLQYSEVRVECRA